jgi:hypothetical protein
MNEDLREIFKESLKDLKDDLRQMDNKFDRMHEVLVENSAILKEHERRSTASEKRLDLLETQVSKIETKRQRLKGFLMYSSIIGSAISLLTGVVYYIVQMLRK